MQGATTRNTRSGIARRSDAAARRSARASDRKGAPSVNRPGLAGFVAVSRYRRSRTTNHAFPISPGTGLIPAPALLDSA